MNLVIAGGGNVGYYLAKTLCERKYHVCIIEQKTERCEWIENSNLVRNLILIHGDATDEQIQMDAGVRNCDTFIAVTGQDQNNLTACMLAKQLLHAKRTITRVNNPKNIRIFQQLGVDSVVSSADRISNMIEQELEWADIGSILSEKTENARIRQCIVGVNSIAAGRMLSKIKLPQETIIIVVVRGNRAFIPNGKFCLEEGDEVVVMGAEENLLEAEKLFYHEANV
jgi:trk system potassium uptake protein TrkA